MELPPRFRPTEKQLAGQRAAVAQERAALARAPDALGAQGRLAESLVRYANLLHAANALGEARAACDEAIALRRLHYSPSAPESDPARELAYALSTQAHIEQDLGHITAARGLLEETIELRRFCTSRKTADEFDYGNLSGNLAMLASLEEDAGDFVAARRALQEAIAAHRATVASITEAPLSYLAGSPKELEELIVWLDTMDFSERLFELRTAQEQASRKPESLLELARRYGAFADEAKRAGAWHAASKAAWKAVAMCRELVALRPEDPEARAELERSRQRVGPGAKGGGSPADKRPSPGTGQRKRR
jgi:hypothetical protein